VKIEQNTRITLKRKPEGTRKDGARLDLLLDALTTMRAAGVPDGATVKILDDYDNKVVVEAHWTEDRGSWRT
jgi:hypothetical protein